MPFAMPWPTRPQTIPARLYSKNFTPMHAARLADVYLGWPGREGSNAALGTLANALLMPATSAHRPELHCNFMYRIVLHLSLSWQIEWLQKAVAFAFAWFSSLGYIAGHKLSSMVIACDLHHVP